jgi:light-harvesting complex I chlorophyll a/b binding protein 1
LLLHVNCLPFSGLSVVSAPPPLGRCAPPNRHAQDPLGLGKTESSLERFTEAELMNGRWAMLGVAGALVPEVLGLGDWWSAPLWAVNGGSPSYLGAPLPFSLETLLAVEFVAMAGVESLRGGQEEAVKRKYPGMFFLRACLKSFFYFFRSQKIQLAHASPLAVSTGGPFDPMGLSKGNIDELKTKELKNGRLAMVAFIGFIGQHAANGELVRNFVACLNLCMTSWMQQPVLT